MEALIRKARAMNLDPLSLKIEVFYQILRAKI
jgi:hypothetical protein